MGARNGKKKERKKYFCPPPFRLGKDQDIDRNTEQEIESRKQGETGAPPSNTSVQNKIKYPTKICASPEGYPSERQSNKNCLRKQLLATVRVACPTPALGQKWKDRGCPSRKRR